MKPTYKNLAKKYNLTYQTVSTWSEKKPELYEAMRDKFIKDNQMKDKKMSNCCKAKIVFHKGNWVCSCCGMPHKKA